MPKHDDVKAPKVELKVWELTVVWLLLVLCTVTVVWNFSTGDDGWAYTFVAFGVFFAVVLWAAYTQRRWNRDGRPGWIGRYLGRR